MTPCCARPAAQLLRVLDSLLLAAKYLVATPADWHQGEEVMISPGVDDEEAMRLVRFEGSQWCRASGGRPQAEGCCCAC